MTAATARPLTPPLPLAFPASSTGRPPKKRLPAGRPREWYVSHNRQLKAMRIAIALLDSGVYAPSQAGDRTIRRTAARIGVHPPSDTTCELVRSLLP
ncbi:hypothetical protein [Streptomyces winkii]|uniref:hypothetical protein n=1 Tax=Streptomyces winkii TaxID=3051178 RepID=UPI0028D67E28|nr:hypothetical protein [Streptomyces sp. DSM 40971]